MTTAAQPDADAIRREMERLRVENRALVLERRELELKVKQLQHQLWGRKSERSVPAAAGAQGELFVDPAAQADAAPDRPARPPDPARGQPAAVAQRRRCRAR